MYAACAFMSFFVLNVKQSQILKMMKKVNWNVVAQILKFLATVITSVLGTMAVQSCTSEWF